MTLSLERYGEDGFVELGTETATLRVGGNGRLTLFRKMDDGSSVAEAANACVSVPSVEGEGEESEHFSISREAGGSAILITWPGRALLRVLPVDTHRLCDEEAWLGDLHHHGGFILQFTALRGDESEVTVDMESSGSWYGGGHLMKQHWPLNKGCWEVGPYYVRNRNPPLFFSCLFSTCSHAAYTFVRQLALQRARLMGLVDHPPWTPRSVN